MANGRTALQINTSLDLADKNNMVYRYTIKHVLNLETEGASCICYIADRVYDSGIAKPVILKEFYPRGAAWRIKRSDEGELVYDEGTDIAYAKENYLRGIRYLEQFSADGELGKYICTEDDTGVLWRGNVPYCENSFYDGAINWKSMREDGRFKMDTIFYVALGSFRFLRSLHKKGFAYVDFKPEDVLVRVSESGMGAGDYDFMHPLFYDFNSVLPLGKCYREDEILYTAEYVGNHLAYEIAEKGMGHVNLQSEYNMFGKVLAYQTAKKMEMVSLAVRERIKKLLNDLKSVGEDGGGDSMEQHIETELENIIKNIQEDEYAAENQALPQKIKSYRRRHAVVLAVTIVSSLILTVEMLLACMTAFEIKIGAVDNRVIFLTVMAVALFGMIISGYGNWNLSKTIAKDRIRMKYYNSDIRTGEFNTFREKPRASSTYQDKSESNMQRQRFRRKIWILLGAEMVAAFIISLIVKSFPVFLSLGFLALLVHTFVDFLPANRQFFRNYLKLSPVAKKNKEWAEDMPDGVRKARALYYFEEFKESDGTLDLKNDFYRNANRDIFRMRDRVIENCFSPNFIKGMTVWEKIKWICSYECRVNITKKSFDSFAGKMDLGFMPLHIRHIYKMTFDRIKNTQGVRNATIWMIAIIAVFLSFMNLTGCFTDYFRLNGKICGLFSVVCIICAGVGSVLRVLNAMQTELMAAEVSYKSRFVLSEALNDELIKDVASAIVQPIDFSRGTHQYDGYVTTLETMRSRKSFNSSEILKSGRKIVENRPLFHHREISNRGRLAITVWLGFGAMASLLVWHMGYYNLIFILFAMAADVHWIFREYILPVWGKEQILNDIKSIYEKANSPKKN